MPVLYRATSKRVSDIGAEVTGTRLTLERALVVVVLGRSRDRERVLLPL
jgi:hypothetical protein